MSRPPPIIRAFPVPQPTSLRLLSIDPGADSDTVSFISKQNNRIRSQNNKNLSIWNAQKKEYEKKQTEKITNGPHYHSQRHRYLGHRRSYSYQTGPERSEGAISQSFHRHQGRSTPEATSSDRLHPEASRLQNTTTGSNHTSSNRIMARRLLLDYIMYIF
jgi:hypothetical protein